MGKSNLKIHPTETVFKRSEKKYLIDESTYHALIARITENDFEHVNWKKSSDFSPTSSMYFDSQRFHLLWKSVNRTGIRQKIRVRKYDLKKGTSFLEIKSRTKGISKKRRFLIQDLWIDDIFIPIDREVSLHAFLTSLPFRILLKRICMLNRKVDPFEIESTLREILHIHFTFWLKPVMQISVERSSFVSKTRGKDLRLTIDRNLVYCAKRTTTWHQQPETMAALPEVENLYILEIKYSKKLPQSLLEILDDLDIHRVRFSKYNHTMLCGHPGIKNRCLVHPSLIQGD